MKLLSYFIGIPFFIIGLFIILNINTNGDIKSYGAASLMSGLLIILYSSYRR